MVGRSAEEGEEEEGEGTVVKSGVPEEVRLLHVANLYTCIILCPLYLALVAGYKGMEVDSTKLFVLFLSSRIDQLATTK